jgi:hypothetical protein
MYDNTPTINQPATYLISGILRNNQTIPPEIKRQVNAVIGTAILGCNISPYIPALAK